VHTGQEAIRMDVDVVKDKKKKERGHENAPVIY
jgi:hypothetical protein